MMKKTLLFIASIILVSCAKDVNNIENYYDSKIKISFYINGIAGEPHGAWVYLSEQEFHDDNWYTQIASLDTNFSISIPKNIDTVWIRCLKMNRDFTYEKVQVFKLPSHRNDLIPTYRINMVADVRKTCFRIKSILMQPTVVPKKKVVGGNPYSGYIVDEWDDSFADDLSGSKPDIYMAIEDIYKSPLFNHVDYPFVESLVFEPTNVIIDKDSKIKVKLMDYDFKISPDDPIDSCTVSLPYFPNDHYYPVKKLSFGNFTMEIDWL